MPQALWIQALKTVPKVNKEQWDSLGMIARWLIASRFSVTIMTFTSALAGILLAMRDGPVNGLLSMLCVAGLILAHATNNLINDYIDSVRGVDDGNYFRTKYGTHVLEHGLMTKKELINYILFSAFFSLLCGLAIVYVRGSYVLWLMLSGAFFVLFYTWPLKKFALGEVSVLLVWGPLMVGGSYLASSGHWSNTAALIGVLYALGPTAVIFGKHIDKIEMDKSKGIFSLPVVLGDKYSRKLSQLLLISQYMLAVYLYWSGLLGYSILWLLVALPAMFNTLRILNQPRPERVPEGFRQEVWPLWYAPNAFQYTRRFSVCLLLMLLSEYFLPVSQVIRVSA